MVEEQCQATRGEARLLRSQLRESHICILPATPAESGVRSKIAPDEVL